MGQYVQLLTLREVGCGRLFEGPYVLLRPSRTYATPSVNVLEQTMREDIGVVLEPEAWSGGEPVH